MRYDQNSGDPAPHSTGKSGPVGFRGVAFGAILTGSLACLFLLPDAAALPSGVLSGTVAVAAPALVLTPGLLP